MSTDITPYTKEVLAEIMVTYSCSIAPQNQIQIRSSRDARNIFRQIWADNTLEYKEQFYVLCLSRSNRLIGYFLHSMGGLSGTVVDTKQILGVALKANAASLILGHNHPSGNLSPSTMDKTLTRKIVQAAAVMDLCILDHLILTSGTYFSFVDEGILPTGNTERIASYE